MRRELAASSRCDSMAKERIDREFTAISRCRARLHEILAVLLDSARNEVLARLGWRRIRVEEAG